jgi:hypothetical protein
MCGFFTFEWSSQLTRMVSINFANDTITHYKFVKSTTVRENESIGHNWVSDRVYIFDTTLRDGEQSPGFKEAAPFLLTLSMACFISIQFAERTF